MFTLLQFFWSHGVTQDWDLCGAMCFTTKVVDYFALICVCILWEAWQSKLLMLRYWTGKLSSKREKLSNWAHSKNIAALGKQLLDLLFDNTGNSKKVYACPLSFSIRRSSLQWVQEGDDNNEIFHNYAKSWESKLGLASNWFGVKFIQNRVWPKFVDFRKISTATVLKFSVDQPRQSNQFGRDGNRVVV